MTPVTPSSVCDMQGERELFAVWHKSKFGRAFTKWVPEQGRFAWDLTQELWNAWQARAALAERTQQEAPTPMQPSDDAIQEWRDKAADYDRLKIIARNRRYVLEEIAGLKNLTATDKQFWQALQRLAKKAVDNYTFQGDYEDRPEQQAGGEVSDDLAYALLGYRPEQMSERDAAIIRERAGRRWADLCEVAQVPNYKAMYEELAHGIAAEHNEEMRRIGRVE